MRVVSWNCQGGFQNKFQHLDDYGADVCVIQECADPARSSNTEYQSWAKNYLWTGGLKDDMNKGVGVFARGDMALQSCAWAAREERADLEIFLPFRVNDAIDLVGVWTKPRKSSYIVQLSDFMDLYAERLRRGKLAICGDLNSHSVFDGKHGRPYHKDVVAALTELGIVSLYHEHKNEAHGAETSPTLYMKRNPDAPFHIDYVFLSRDLLPDSSLEVGSPDFWLRHSDHMPLIFNLA